MKNRLVKVGHGLEGEAPDEKGVHFGKDLRRKGDDLAGLTGGKALGHLAQHGVRARFDTVADVDTASVRHSAQHFLIYQVDAGEALPVYRQADRLECGAKIEHPCLVRDEVLVLKQEHGHAVGLEQVSHLGHHALDASQHGLVLPDGRYAAKGTAVGTTA